MPRSAPASRSSEAQCHAAAGTGHATGQPAPGNAQWAASLAGQPAAVAVPRLGRPDLPVHVRVRGVGLSWRSAGVAGGMGGATGSDAAMAAAFRLLRSTWAAAAQPAPSTTTPATMSGQRRRLALGGSIRRAAVTIAAETAGAIRSCTATPPASTRGAVQARASSRPLARLLLGAPGQRRHLGGWRPGGRAPGRAPQWPWPGRRDSARLPPRPWPGTLRPDCYFSKTPLTSEHPRTAPPPTHFPGRQRSTLPFPVWWS